MRKDDSVVMANAAKDGKDSGLIKVGENWGIRLDQLDEMDKKLLRSLLNVGWGANQSREIGGERVVGGGNRSEEKMRTMGFDIVGSGNSEGDCIRGTTDKSNKDRALSDKYLETSNNDNVMSSFSTTSAITPLKTNTTAATATIGGLKNTPSRKAVSAEAPCRGVISGKVQKFEKDKPQKQGSRFEKSMRVLEWLDADCGTRLTRHYEKSGGWRDTKQVSANPAFSGSPSASRAREGKTTAQKFPRQGLFIHLPKGGILGASAGHIIQHQLVSGSPQGAKRPPLRMTRSHILSHTTDLWHGYVKDSEEESDSVTGGGSTGSATGSVETPKRNTGPEMEKKPRPQLSSIPRAFFTADGDTTSQASDDSFLADDNSIIFDASDDEEDDDDLVLALRRWEEEQLEQQDALDEISMQEYVTSSEDDDTDNEETVSIWHRKNSKTKVCGSDSSAIKLSDTADANNSIEDEESDSSEDELVKAIRSWQEEQERFARLQQLQQQRRSSLGQQPPPLTPVLEEEKEAVPSSSSSPCWEPFGYFYRERNLLVYQVNSPGGSKNVPPHLMHQPYWWEDISSVREGPSSPPVIAKNRKDINPFTKFFKSDSKDKTVDNLDPAASTSPGPSASPASKSKKISSFFTPSKTCSLSSTTTSTQLLPPKPSPSKLSLLPTPAHAQSSLSPLLTPSSKRGSPFFNIASSPLLAPPNSPNPVTSSLLHSPSCVASSLTLNDSNKELDAHVNKCTSLRTNQNSTHFSAKDDMKREEVKSFQKSTTGKTGVEQGNNSDLLRIKTDLILTQCASFPPNTSTETTSSASPYLTSPALPLHTSPALAKSTLIIENPGAQGGGTLTSLLGPAASGVSKGAAYSAALDSSEGLDSPVKTSKESQWEYGGGDFLHGNSSGRDGSNEHQLYSTNVSFYSSNNASMEKSHSNTVSVESNSSQSSGGSSIDKISEFFKKVGSKLSGSSQEQQNHDQHRLNQHIHYEQQQKHQEPPHQQPPQVSSHKASVDSLSQIKQRHHSADNGSKLKFSMKGSGKLSLSSPSLSPTASISQNFSPFLKSPLSPNVSSLEKHASRQFHSPCTTTYSDPMATTRQIARAQASGPAVLRDKYSSRSESYVPRSSSNEERNKLNVPLTGLIIRNLSADNITASNEINDNDDKVGTRRRKTGVGLENISFKNTSPFSDISKHGLTQGTATLSSFSHVDQNAATSKARGAQNSREERGGGGGEKIEKSERGANSIVNRSAHATATLSCADRNSSEWGVDSKSEPTSTSTLPDVGFADNIFGITSSVNARKINSSGLASTSTSATFNYQHQSADHYNKPQEKYQQQQPSGSASGGQSNTVFLTCGKVQPFVVPQSYHNSQLSPYQQHHKLQLLKTHGSTEQRQQQQQQPSSGNSPSPRRLFPRNKLDLSSKTSDLLLSSTEDYEATSPNPDIDNDFKSMNSSTWSSKVEKTKPKRGFIRKYFTFDTENRSLDKEKIPCTSQGSFNIGDFGDGDKSDTSYTSKGVGVTARYTNRVEDVPPCDNKTQLRQGSNSGTNSTSAAATAYREVLLSSRAGSGTSERSSSTSSDERGPKGGGGEGAEANTLAIPGTSVGGRGEKDQGAGGRRSSHGTCNHLFLQQLASRKSTLPPAQQLEQQQLAKLKKSPSPVRGLLLKTFHNNSSSLSSNSSCGYGGTAVGAGGSITTPPISPPAHPETDKHHSSSSSLETSPRRNVPELPPVNYRGRRKFSDTGLTPIPRRLLTDGRRGSLTDEKTLVSAKSKLGKLRRQARKSSVATLVKQIHNLWDDGDDEDDNNSDDGYNDDDSDNDKGKNKGNKKSSSRRSSGSLLCSFDDQVLFEKKKKKFPLSLTGSKNKSNTSNNGSSSGVHDSVERSETDVNSKGDESLQGKGNIVIKTEPRNDAQGERVDREEREVERRSGQAGSDRCLEFGGSGQSNAKPRGANVISDTGLSSSCLAKSSVAGASSFAGNITSNSVVATGVEDKARIHCVGGRTTSGGYRINPNERCSYSTSNVSVGSHGVVSTSDLPSLSCIPLFSDAGNSISGSGVVASELVAPVAQVAGRQLVATAVGGAAAACLQNPETSLFSRGGNGNDKENVADPINTASLSHHTSNEIASVSKGKHHSSQGASGKRHATVQFEPIVSWDDNSLTKRSPVSPAARSVLKQGARRHSSFAGFPESDDSNSVVSSPTHPGNNKSMPSSSTIHRPSFVHQESVSSALSPQAKHTGLPKSKTSDVFRSILKQPERPAVAQAIDLVGGKAGAIASGSTPATTFSSINPASCGVDKKRSKSASPKSKKTEKGSEIDNFDASSKATDISLSLCLKASKSLSPKHKKSRALESGRGDSVDSTDQCCQVLPLFQYDKEHHTDSGHSSLDLSSTKTVGIQVSPRTIGKTSNTGTQTSEALNSGGRCNDSGTEHSNTSNTGGGSSVGFPGVEEGTGWLQRLASKCMASVGGASRTGPGRGGEGRGARGAGGGLFIKVGGNASMSGSASTAGGSAGAHPRAANVRAEWLLGSKRMGSSPSSPVSAGADATGKFWVPQGLIARKRAQSLVPTLSKQESEEGKTDF
ncbi:hypothetical protein PoB_007222600 [Plakobranchus ocellatus]|uniref:Uncharacterized protein n=1 Tax=Plakobranchus ocellatus TaxID=259542 RepID=A0AAV4DPB7_9GAST|nr:hypothetical protein PoB_007222600 [Plakobranchus ocellatus]